MKFTYAYKTSDGKRHEAAIEAVSREEVFATLRARGIKAIKVVAEDGSRANGWRDTGRADTPVRSRAWQRAFLSVATVAAALILIAALAFFAFKYLAARRVGGYAPHQTAREDARPPDAEAAALKEIVEKADAAKRRWAGRLDALRIDEIASPAGVMTNADVSARYRIAKDAQKALERAKAETRAVFAAVATAFPPDSAAAKDAQRLYGERMAELDAAEISLSNRKFALALLEANRGKWTLSGAGEAVFLDARLARMYRYCLDGIGTAADTVRWQRDFSTAD